MIDGIQCHDAKASLLDTSNLQKQGLFPFQHLQPLLEIPYVLELYSMTRYVASVIPGFLCSFQQSDSQEIKAGKLTQDLARAMDGRMCII